MRAIMSMGMSLESSCIAHQAAARPSALPADASTSPSVTNWPIRRARDAPSELRTAISLLRLSERTSSRLDTFTAAINSSRPAPPSSTRRIGRISPTMTSFSGATAAP